MSDHDHTHGVEDIDCIEAINGLYAYLDGEMHDADSIARFEKHLEHCHACFSRTELETALSEAMRRAARERAPERLQRRLKGLLDEL